MIEIFVKIAAQSIFNHLVKYLKLKWNFKKLEKHIKKELEELSNITSLYDTFEIMVDFNDYIINFLNLPNETSIKDLTKNKEIIESKFSSVFESEKLKNAIISIKNVLKTDSPAFQLYTIKKAFTHDFFMEVFCPDNPTENDIEVVGIIGKIIKAAFLKFIDIENIIMDIWDMLIQLHKAKYNENQFNEYQDLWNKLIDLKISADELWENVDMKTLYIFEQKYNLIDEYITRNSIIIDLKHYKDLEKLLNLFKFYGIGKNKLFETLEESQKKIKRDKKHVYVLTTTFSDEPPDVSISEEQKNIIEKNLQFKKDYENALNNLMTDFRNIR